ncbi:hypothetical protein F2Q70_00033066 [Brassica cretica]|uniref:Uncharacterized protein n=1 Tax=Brassica cretica TaxID=69181 RepID=A0A8S9FCN4_BRACR|nr:hypothetical protein F2Q70_00033066 [Brassica cretica]
MISLRICVEFCAIKGKFSLTLSDLLPKTCGARRLTRRSFLLQSLVMEDSLQLSLKSMKLVDDEEPLTLPDSPRFRVFDENSTSLLGRHIPTKFFTTDTMFKLASEVGKVEEIAYDPKVRADTASSCSV